MLGVRRCQVHKCGGRCVLRIEVDHLGFAVDHLIRSIVRIDHQRVVTFGAISIEVPATRAPVEVAR